MDSKLCDVIWNLSSFEDLKKYLRQGNDFCRDVSTIINERVKIEMAYTEGLAKIGARAKKVTGETLGTMKSAWETLANEFEQEAEIRKTAGTDLLEQIVKPFKTFIDAQKESRKQAELAIEKAAKYLTDKKSEEMKAKKLSFSRAKESESLTAQLESSREKTANEKELSKLDTKCKKAEENVQKSDKEHITKVIQAERGRLALDAALRNTCMELQSLEEERISYIKNMLKVYTEILQEAIPKSVQSYDVIKNATDGINIDNDIQLLLQSKGCEKQPGDQILFTCYETDMNSPMDTQRRKLALEHKYEELNKVLISEKKARAGLAKLASVYQETPSFSDAGTAEGVSTQIAHANAVIDCIDASLHHVASTLSTLNGYEQPHHRLSDCIQKGKDKQNLPSLTMKVPFNRVIIGIPDEGDYEELGATPYSHYDYETDEFEDIPHDASAEYQPMQQNAAEASAAALGNGNMSKGVKRLHYYSVVDGQPETWRVLYDYNAAQEDELTIQPGDVINVISKSDGGWWTGELNGQTGLFPANYVEQI